MADSNVSDRLYFTAYLYSEYVLRNIESNKPELLEWLKNIKIMIRENLDIFYNDIYKYICDNIQNNIKNGTHTNIHENISNDYYEAISDEFSVNILLDTILENECFFNSSEYECDLFSGSLLKRLTSRKEYKGISIKYVDELNEYLRSSSQFKEIVKISLEEGIYMTHLDSFRSEKYYLTIPDPLPKKLYLRHIFFKDEKSFWKGDKHIYYNIPEYNIANKRSLINDWERRSEFSMFSEDLETHLMEKELERELAIYFPIFDDNFDLNTYLSQAQSIIVASRLDNIESIIDNYKKYSYFIDRFFSKDIHRFLEYETKGKILGILLWDGMRYSNSISKLIESISKKYNTRLFSPEHCSEAICTSHCASSSNCSLMAKRLYKVADQSIKNKKIITSKELK